MPAVHDALINLNLRDEYTMADVFESLRGPLRALNDVRPNGTSRFMLLIGRGYTDVQGHLRWFITTRYNDALSLFIESVMKANPDLTRETLFWRLHFTLGTCVFTMSSSQALAQIAENDFGNKVDAKAVVDQIIPYLAAGVAAH